MRRSPLMHTVTLTTANVVSNLYDLLKARLQAIDPNFPAALLNVRCAAVQIQSDISNGGAELSIGDPDTLKTTDRGLILVASQAWSVDFESNLLMLRDIGLMSDTNSTLVNVVVVIR